VLDLPLPHGRGKIRDCSKASPRPVGIAPLPHALEQLVPFPAGGRLNNGSARWAPGP